MPLTSDNYNITLNILKRFGQRKLSLKEYKGQLLNFHAARSQSDVDALKKLYHLLEPGSVYGVERLAVHLKGEVEFRERSRKTGRAEDEEKNLRKQQIWKASSFKSGKERH